MVFIGGWRSRRRGYGAPYGGYGPGYRGGGYGYGGGGSSCMRDMFLVEGGCCLAELLGCGPQLLLVAPSLVRHARWAAPAAPVASGTRSRFAAAIIALIRLYQTEISSRRPASCRFSPTCSHYAIGAYQAHGVVRGSWLTVRRLLRCRPGGRHGHDPVPSATR